MKRLLLVLLSACGPTVMTAPGYTGSSDPMVNACQQNANQLLMICQQRPTPQPPGHAEQMRRSYESQRTACSAEVLAPLDRCVRELEAIALAQDPDAKERRAAARANAEATREDAAFQQRIDQWLQIFDQMKIQCAHQQASASYARECSRTKTDLDAVELDLRAFLEARGFDMRDVGELGLWPSSPDGLGG